MKYHTINELDHFCFKEAYIAQICAVSGMFEIVFDNVTILPANSCNRDIREMRANELVLKISEPKIEALVEEGYKVYDANGNLKQKNEDITIAPESYADKFKEDQRADYRLYDPVYGWRRWFLFDTGKRYPSDQDQKQQ